LPVGLGLMLVMVSFMACPFLSEVAARAVADLHGERAAAGEVRHRRR